MTKMQEYSDWKDYPSKVDDCYSFQSFDLMKELADLWHSGTEHINYSLFENYLHLKENDDLNARCIASADLLISTKTAIITFKERQRSIQLKTLDIFGIFQALIVQQDAVNVLYQILLKQITQKDKFSKKIQEAPFWQKEDDLKQIRNIRNEIIGHPPNIRKGHKREYACTNIMRIDRNNYIGYIRYGVGENNATEPTEFPTVDIQKCLEGTRRGIIEIPEANLQKHQ